MTPLYCSLWIFWPVMTGDLHWSPSDGMSLPSRSELSQIFHGSLILLVLKLLKIQRPAENCIDWPKNSHEMWSLFFNIIPHVFHSLLPSVLKDLDSISKKHFQKRYDVIIGTFQPINFSDNPRVYLIFQCIYKVIFLRFYIKTICNIFP